MNTFHSLLTATDFSGDADNACLRAALLAAEQGAALELLHVISEPSLALLRGFFPDLDGRITANAKQTVDRISAELATTHGIAVKGGVQVGTVAATILAAMPRIDLLVVGAHGSNPLRDLILGTTAERLLVKATRPALVVKQPALEPYRRVIAAIDFSPYSAAVLSKAAALAPGAELHVCHAFDVPFEGKLWMAGVADEQITYYRAEAHHRAMAAIHKLVDSQPGLKKRLLRPKVVRGDATRVILDQEAACRADLIVIGRQGQSILEEFLLGSVTRHVMSNSKCDVLVINAH